VPKRAHWDDFESHASVPNPNPVPARFVTVRVPSGRVDIFRTNGEAGPTQVAGPYASVDVAMVALDAMNRHEHTCGFCNNPARPAGSVCDECGMPDFAVS
jgi:hypothetical protein